MTETTPPTQIRKRSLAWGMRWFAVALGFSYLVRMSRGAVLPKLLAPELYGLAMSLLLPITYLRYSDLGVLDQLNKRLPYFRASEGEEAFRRHISLGAAWTLGTALVAAWGLVVASFWVGGAKADYYRVGFRLVAVLLVAQRLRYLLSAQLNAREEFRTSQMGSMLTEGTAFAYSVIFVVWLGPMGIIWALLFSEITVSIYLGAKAGIPRLSFALRPMLTMVREGLVLLCLALVEIMMLTMDQVFLLRFFPVSQYGLYMLGGALANLFELPRALFEATSPRVLSLAGPAGEAESKQVISSTLSLYSLILVVMVGLSVPATAFALRFYLTRYQAGMGLYIVVPIYSVMHAPVSLLRSFNLARNQERRLILYNLAGLVTIVILDGLVVAFGGGMVWIAVATAIGSGVPSVLLIRRFEGSLSGVAHQFKKYALYVASGAGIAGLYAFWAITSAGTSGQVNVVGLSIAAFVYGLGMLGAIYFTRTEWLAALKVVRAQPPPQEKDLGPVLSEVAE